jgi:hypothetical protein
VWRERYGEEKSAGQRKRQRSGRSAKWRRRQRREHLQPGVKAATAEAAAQTQGDAGSREEEQEIGTGRAGCMGSGQQLGTELQLGREGVQMAAASMAVGDRQLGSGEVGQDMSTERGGRQVSHVGQRVLRPRRLLSMEDEEADEVVLLQQRLEEAAARVAATMAWAMKVRTELAVRMEGEEMYDSMMSEVSPDLASLTQQEVRAVQQAMVEAVQVARGRAAVGGHAEDVRRRHERTSRTKGWKERRRQIEESESMEELRRRQHVLAEQERFEERRMNAKELAELEEAMVEGLPLLTRLRERVVQLEGAVAEAEARDGSGSSRGREAEDEHDEQEISEEMIADILKEEVLKAASDQLQQARQELDELRAEMTRQQQEHTRSNGLQQARQQLDELRAAMVRQQQQHESSISEVREELAEQKMRCEQIMMEDVRRLEGQLEAARGGPDGWQKQAEWLQRMYAESVVQWGQERNGLQSQLGELGRLKEQAVQAERYRVQYIGMVQVPEMSGGVELLGEMRQAVQGHERLKEEVMQQQPWEGCVRFDYRQLQQSDFQVAQQGNPWYTKEEVREAELRRECRGLVLDGRSGEVLVRPLGKAFMPGQVADMKWEALSQVPVLEVTEKLDGQMVVGVVRDGRVELWSRSGRTPVAESAEACAERSTGSYTGLIGEVESMGCTASFEYVGRQSRIKVRHEGAARLVLIAVRQKVSGEYWEHDGLVQLGRRHGVEVVRRVIMPTTGEQGHVSVWEVERLVKEVGGETEGVMARLHGGALLKLKTGWWLQRQPVQGWRRQKRLEDKLQKRLAHGDDRRLRLVVHGLQQEVAPALLLQEYAGVLKVEACYDVRTGHRRVVVVAFKSEDEAVAARQLHKLQPAYSNRCKDGGLYEVKRWWAGKEG